MLRGKTDEEQDELEEEIVLEILREGRGDREERGEREEWNQHVGWHRKENVRYDTIEKSQTEPNRHKDPTVSSEEKPTPDHVWNGPLRKRRDDRKDLTIDQKIVEATFFPSFWFTVPAMIFLGIVVVWWNAGKIQRNSLGRRRIRNRSTKGRTL